MKREQKPQYNGSMDPVFYAGLQQQGLQRDALITQRNLLYAGVAGRAAKATAGGLYDLLVKAPVQAGWEATKGLGRGALNLASLAAQIGIMAGGVYLNALLSEPAAYTNQDTVNEAYNQGRGDGRQEGAQAFANFFGAAFAGAAGARPRSEGPQSGFPPINIPGRT